MMRLSSSCRSFVLSLLRLVAPSSCRSFVLSLLRLVAPSSCRSFVLSLLRLVAPSSCRSFVAIILLILCLLPSCQAQTLLSSAVGTDNLTRLLWNSGNGVYSLWRVNADASVTVFPFGPYSGWSATQVAIGADNVPRILWNKTDGTMSLWSFNESADTFTTYTYGPFAGWNAAALAVGGNNVPRVMWNKTDGTMALWSVNTSGGFTQASYGPYPGWTASFLAVGPNSVPRLLWISSANAVALWVNADVSSANVSWGPYTGYHFQGMTVDSNNTPRILCNDPANNAVNLWTLAPSGTSCTGQYYNAPAGFSLAWLNSAPGDMVNLIWINPNGPVEIMPVSGTGFVQPVTVISPIASQNGPGSVASHGAYTVQYSGGLASASTGSVGSFATSNNIYSGTISASGYNGNGNNITLSAQCGGQITATFTWVPAAAYPNSPPPSQATVTQTCTSSWSAGGYAPGFTGSCNDSLGQSDGPTTGANSDSVTGSSSFVKSQPGQSFTISPPCNPASSISGSTNVQCSNVSAFFTYNASASFPNITTSLLGYSTVPVTGWDGTHPLYFSGTNCSATASATASSGNTVKQIQLLVGGVLTKEYDDTASPPATKNAAIIYTSGTSQSTAGLTINFDSTYFRDASLIPIQMIVTDSSGNTLNSPPVQSYAYNKAVIYGRNQWESGNAVGATAGTPSAKLNLSAMNHNVDILNITKGWSAANVLNDIGLCTAFYVNTHGNSFPEFLSDADELGNPSDGVYPSASSAFAPPQSTQVIETRKGANPGVPPVNMAFIDACQTGESSGFGDAFLYPYTSVNAVDQAEVGWYIEASVYGVYGECPAFWSALLSGKTVSQARDAMVKAYFVVLSQSMPSGTQPSDYAKVYGDVNARLHTVYTGDNNAPLASGWYR